MQFELKLKNSNSIASTSKIIGASLWKLYISGTDESSFFPGFYIIFFRGELAAIKSQKYALLLISLSIINCYGSPPLSGCLPAMSAQYFTAGLSIAADRKCRRNSRFFFLPHFPCCLLWRRFEYLSRPSQDLEHNHLLDTQDTTSLPGGRECI